MSKMTITANVHSITKTRNGDYIHRFLVGDKVIKVFSKENDLRPGQYIRFDVSIPEDSHFPMLFEIKNSREYLSPPEKK